jgi:hypothetical protein
MALTSKAAAFVKKLSKKYPKSEQDDFDLAAKSVEATRKTKRELIEESKDAEENVRFAAKDELRRREMNKQKKKEGKSTETAPSYKELREGYEEDKEYFLKGGMAKKKPAVKKPAVKKPAVKKPTKKGK